VVVASIDTYLKYADAVGLTGLVARPQLGSSTETELAIEPARRVPRIPTRRSAREQLSILLARRNEPFTIEDVDISEHLG